MVDTWFTSDHHFGHANIIASCDRPQYNDEDYEEQEDGSLGWVSQEIKKQRVQEMDEMLISRWNARVKKGDNVYYLGDFSFYNVDDTEKIIRRLNGSIHLIAGNHDKKIRKKAQGFAWIKDVYDLKIHKKNIWLSHFPHRSWDKSSHGSWHLHGHTHGGFEPFGRSFDVGVDCWDYYPISISQVAAFMSVIESNL